MKKILIIFAIAAFTSSAYSQENTNEKKETVVTKTAVKSDKGTEVVTKEVTQTENQVIALNNNESNQTNQDVVWTPVNVKTDVNYSNEGSIYTFQTAPIGYKMMTSDAGSIKDYAIVRPSSQKGYYIMSQEGNSSFGYFNQNGDFVVERYDPASDAIISTVYQLQVKETKMMKKDKM